MIKPDLIQKIREIISQRNLVELGHLTNGLMPSELVALLSEIPESDFEIYDTLNLTLAVRAFKFLPLYSQKKFIAKMSSEKLSQVINQIKPDDRTWILKELPGTTVQGLLKILKPDECALTLELLGFPKGSIGRLMTPEYLTVLEEWSAQEVLEFIRKNGKNSETISYLFIVDSKGKLIDDINLRDFLFAEGFTKVKQLMDYHFLALKVNDNQDSAINIFRKFNRTALPVVDLNGILLGIVTIDDILRLSNQEATSDIQQIGGSEVLNEPYMEIPFMSLIKKRVSWLIILFLGEMLTATAMGFFSDTISKFLVLALFIPLIISSGGNSGSQASTLIIRAMALGEIGFKDWWRVMRREIKAGLFLGTVLGLVGFIRIAAWTLFTPIYGPHWMLYAITIFFALIGVVLWGTLSGSMLPLILKRLGADPATSSAPFVATLVDVTGLIIYFTIAIAILGGTLIK